MLQTCDTDASHLVGLANMILTDDERQREKELYYKNGTTTWTTLAWPEDICSGKESYAKTSVDLQNDDRNKEHLQICNGDERVANLFCDENEVEIRMAMWCRKRVVEMETGYAEFLMLYDSARFDEALQIGIEVLTQCDYDGVQYDMRMMSILKEYVTCLLSIVLTRDMDTGKSLLVEAEDHRE
jgi:hypothetical protein